MTSREAYVLGWCYGTICRAAGNDHISGDFALAAQRPYSASAKIIAEASRRGLLVGDVDRQIAEAMTEVTSLPDTYPEPYLALELQGSWQMGYFAGKSGAPLAREKFDIKAARAAKRMTQSQLAEAVGVGQDQVSRWESGKVSPSKANLQKLKEILA